MSANETELLSLAGLLSHRANECPEKSYVQIDDSSMTYIEVDEAAKQFATTLKLNGLEAGDRVAFLTAYLPEVVPCVFGVLRRAAVNVILNPFLRGEFLHHQLDDSGASTLVVDVDGYRACQAILQDLPSLRRIVVLNDPGGSLTNPRDVREGIEVIHWDTILSGPASDEIIARVQSDPFALVYTSGTTGLPKACILSEGYMNRIARVYGEAFDAGQSDILLTATPLYHISGYVGMFSTLLHQMSLVVMSSFHASTYMERAAEVGATLFYGVGFHTHAILEQPPTPKDKDHKLRFGWFGPFPPEAQLAFEERFGVTLMCEMYAQTECAMISRGVIGEKPKGNAGRPLDDVDVQIVDDEDFAVTTGEVGEIVVRPKQPNVLFSGYWNRGDATQSAWQNLWHHTGDLGRLDEEGNLHFVDRKVDSIRHRGEMISAFQLDQAIAKHDKVVEVATHGVRIQTEVDDVIKAWIVVKEGAELAPEELGLFFRENLPYYAIPRFVELVDTLPRNASGRVLKFELRKRSSESSDAWDMLELGLLPSREERR